MNLNDKSQICIIENYISPHTAKYLTDIFNNELKPTHQDFIHGVSIGGEENAYLIEPSNPALGYNGAKFRDIAVDILTLLTYSISKTISEYAQEPLETRTMFYSAMYPGAKNLMHMDNYYKDPEGNLICREEADSNYSALLYLNEEYTGGLIKFPNQGIEMKPKPGTLIIFEGTADRPHEVTEVLSGIRNVIIAFYWPVSKRGGKPIVSGDVVELSLY